MKSAAALLVTFLLCLSLSAQNDKLVKALYGQVGIGGGTGTTLNTNISTDLRGIGLIRTNFKLCYTSKGNFVENSDQSPYPDEIDEFSLMYGKQINKKFFSYSFSGGITGLRYIDLYNQREKHGFLISKIEYDSKHIYYLGAGANAQIIAQAKYIGIGLEGFAHWNPKLPYYGILLNASFGLIARN